MVVSLIFDAVVVAISELDDDEVLVNRRLGDAVYRLQKAEAVARPPSRERADERTRQLLDLLDALHILDLHTVVLSVGDDVGNVDIDRHDALVYLVGDATREDDDRVLGAAIPWACTSVVDAPVDSLGEFALEE